jgi:hypothetical protein
LCIALLAVDSTHSHSWIPNIHCVNFGMTLGRIIFRIRRG